MAEFERIEGEINGSEAAPKKDASVAAPNYDPMIGSTTSLDEFSMDDHTAAVRSNANLFEFDHQFEAEAQLVVSMLNAGALPVMENESFSSKEDLNRSSEIVPCPLASNENVSSVSNEHATSAGYPEYQDIVQIIREASQIEQSYRAKASDVHHTDSLDDLESGSVKETETKFDAEQDKDSLQEYLPHERELHLDEMMHMSTESLDPDFTVPQSCPDPDFSIDLPLVNQVMQISADSMENLLATTCSRSADIMQDSLNDRYFRESQAFHEVPASKLHESFDADSLHEVSAGFEDESRLHSVILGSMAMSVESGAYSQSDSILSSGETVKSGESIRDIMLVSVDSPDAYGGNGENLLDVFDNKFDVGDNAEPDLSGSVASFAAHDFPGIGHNKEFFEHPSDSSSVWSGVHAVDVGLHSGKLIARCRSF